MLKLAQSIHQNPWRLTEQLYRKRGTNASWTGRTNQTGRTNHQKCSQHKQLHIPRKYCNHQYNEEKSGNQNLIQVRLAQEITAKHWQLLRKHLHNFKGWLLLHHTAKLTEKLQSNKDMQTNGSMHKAPQKHTIYTTTKRFEGIKRHQEPQKHTATRRT